MNLKKFISGVSAFAIAASAFAGMAVTANAAGYNCTLADSYEVAGYTAKAFYDFQNNNPEVLPTSGDLRYRPYEKGGYWGLHNFGSGGRSGTATISVAKDDILVLQLYSSSYVPTIDCGSQNATLTTACSPYYVYDITTTADNITFSVPKSGGIVAALVMEKDASATTAEYTIDYKNGDNTVKSVNGVAAVGATVAADSVFFEGGVKYFATSATSFGVSASGNAFTVSVREAATYAYTAKATIGENEYAIASGSGYEGETVKVAYPRYINVDGTLYQKNVINKEYNYSLALDEDNKVVNFTDYAATDITDVAFYSEAEDIAGLTAVTSGNAAIRSSQSAVAYAGADTVITNLPAGKYVVHGVLYAPGSTAGNLSFALGSNGFAFTCDSSKNWVDVTSEEITITEASDLTFKTSGANNNALDFIYIVKTGDVEPESPVVVISTVEKAQAYENKVDPNDCAVVGKINVNISGGSIDLANATYEGRPATVSGLDDAPVASTTITANDVLIFAVINGTTDTAALNRIVFN